MAVPSRKNRMMQKIIANQDRAKKEMESIDKEEFLNNLK